MTRPDRVKLPAQRMTEFVPKPFVRVVSRRTRFANEEADSPDVDLLKAPMTRHSWSRLLRDGCLRFWLCRNELTCGRIEENPADPTWCPSRSQTRWCSTMSSIALTTSKKSTQKCRSPSLMMFKSTSTDPTRTKTSHRHECRYESCLRYPYTLSVRENQDVDYVKHAGMPSWNRLVGRSCTNDQSETHSDSHGGGSRLSRLWRAPTG